MRKSCRRNVSAWLLELPATYRVAATAASPGVARALLLARMMRLGRERERERDEHASRRRVRAADEAVRDAKRVVRVEQVEDVDPDANG